MSLTNKCIEECIEELKQLLDERYVIRLAVKEDDTNAKIIVNCDFNCNIWKITKKGYNRNGQLIEQGEWENCYKCECHYGCHTSQKFINIIKKYGTFDWINCYTAGIFIPSIKKKKRKILKIVEEEEEEEDSKKCIECCCIEPLYKFTDTINGEYVITDTCKSCYIEEIEII